MEGSSSSRRRSGNRDNHDKPSPSSSFNLPNAIFFGVILTVVIFVIVAYSNQQAIPGVQQLKGSIQGKIEGKEQQLQIQQQQQQQQQQQLVSLKDLLAMEVEKQPPPTTVMKDLFQAVKGDKGEILIKTAPPPTIIENVKIIEIEKTNEKPNDSRVEKATQSDMEKQVEIRRDSIADLGSNSTDPLANARKICQKTYGKRGFFTDAEKRTPPMLYTFPGSGNTWCRLLIEYGTGIYSGSVYNDISLMKALPGEYTCNQRVSVVKVHPHTHPFSALRDGVFHSDGGLKCHKGGVNTFERAVLLIRNPFDCIWSEFQRRVSKSHVGGIRRATFDWSRWQANAASLSTQYFQMWNVQYTGIEKAYATKDILYIRYEDLKDKSARIKVMSKVAKFLGVPVSTDRLECAFTLSTNTQIRRSIDNDKSKTMSKEIAYTKPLTCKMWLLFGTFAAKHGYQVQNGYNCSEYKAKDAIRDIVVGPQGEYNSKYIPPGTKPIDFGGREELPSEAMIDLQEMSKKIRRRKKREDRGLMRERGESGERGGKRGRIDG